ncbi:hypothetical protein NESM_000395500 [Novymonas esmeraldas]|uniref:Uncharacterized protein n=1 Tax=Novymonas esmeraldas TaxID=1808958 RepID=A0AAW0EKV7_9TRYP
MARSADATAAAAPEFATSAVPPLVGLQRLAGNAFALHHVSGPRPAAATAAEPPPPPLPLSAESVVSPQPSASPPLWVTPRTTPRTSWPSGALPPSVAAASSAAAALHGASASAPRPWRGAHDPHGGTRTQPPRGRRQRSTCDESAFMTRPPTASRGHGHGRSFSATEHVAPPPPYDFAAAAAAAPVSLQPFEPSPPHSVVSGSLSGSGAVLSMCWQQQQQQQTFEQRGGHRSAPGPGAGGVWQSTDPATLALLSPLNGTSASATLCSGLSSPRALPVAGAAAAAAPASFAHPPRALAHTGACPPAHRAVDGALVYVGAPLLPHPSPPHISADALHHLFAHYMEAQRAAHAGGRCALTGVPELLGVSLEQQELVLRHVQSFAARLNTPWQQPYVPRSQEALDPPVEGHRWATMTKAAPAAFDSAAVLPLSAPSPPLQSLPPPTAAHARAHVPWDAIARYLPGPPIPARLALRATAPAARRQLERLGWRWLIAAVAASVCPFIVENGAEPHVRDAYARLDGRARHFVGGVPVARLAPLPLTRSATNDSVLDGCLFLECERQSLLLDQAWREGWLHRPGCAHRAALLPGLCGHGPASSRVRVAGVACDVLRSRRSRVDNDGVDGTGAYGDVAEEDSGNVSHRAGLTPPPPPLLNKRPTEALSATRKLLGDAVSAISRERARSADAALPAQQQQHNRLGLHASGLRHTTGPGHTRECRGPAAERRGSEGLMRDVQHHPHLGHSSLPVLVEDSTGTVHLLCTSKTQMSAAAVEGCVSAWLRHRHPPPRRTPCTRTAVPAVVQQQQQQQQQQQPSSSPAVVDDAPLSHAEAARVLGSGRGGVVAVGERVPRPQRPAAESRLDGCRGAACCDGEADSLRPAYKSTDGLPHRALALHLTEQHIPWLARELCPDSASGGLAHLRELHLSVTESMLPPGWPAAWRWCLSVLRARANLLLVSVAARASATSAAERTAAAPRQDGKPSDAPDGVEALGSTTTCAIMAAAALQVLSLQSMAADAVAPLFREVSATTRTDGDHTPATTVLGRLRELYVNVRRGERGDESPRPIGLGEVHVPALVYPVLQVLWLDAPRLRHVHLDRLLSLREVHLVSDASLPCSALRGVERLPVLEVLHLERAIIDDCSFLGDCLSLRELLLHACRLSLQLSSSQSPSSVALATETGDREEELHGVERAPRLETLSLCYTEEVRNLQNFARCRSLRRVLLTRCNGISSSSISGLERLPRLELLAMEYTRVSGLSHLAAAPALRVLRVDGCKRVLRSSVMGLESVAHLTELSLQDTNVSTVANFGGGCAALRSLDLSGCRHLDVEGLQGIQALPQLEVLSLSHTPITDVDFLADCVRLTALYVEGCTGLLPTSLEGLQNASRLQKLVANGCPAITRVGSLGRCPALEVFAVAGAEALTEEGLQGIERGRRLRHLDLSATAVHTLSFLAQGCHALRYLSVKACRRITTAAALHGLERLPLLETLNMECLELRGRLDFLGTATSLRYVSYAGCQGLTPDDVDALLASGVQAVLP